MLKHPEGKKRYILGGIFLLLLVFGGGRYVGASGRAPFAGANTVSSLPPEGVDFAPLYKAWNLLEQHHVPTSTTDATSLNERVWGAVSGLAGSYDDPYTVFLPPQEKELFESEVRGDFQGVGMEIGIRDEILTVISPLKDTPAYRAGIQSGDKVIAIDGLSTGGTSIEAAV